MIDLSIGTRFYYKGVLCEVTPDRERIQCPNCVLHSEDPELCKLVTCNQEKRKDKADVFFEIVEEPVDGE